jgi:hypothetical protein
MANNPYLMVQSRSKYYTSMSVSGLPTFLISVKNMNLLFYLFCQTDTFLFVIETPMRTCKHPFSRSEHLQNVEH